MVTTLSPHQVKQRVTETVNEDNPLCLSHTPPYKEGFEEMFQWIIFYEARTLA
jgi:hypothetical protein